MGHLITIPRTSKQAGKKKIVLLCMLFFAITGIYAQTDRLENKVRTAGSDTQRVNILNLLSSQYLSDFLSKNSAASFDSSIQVASRAYKLSVGINYPRGIGESLLAQGRSLSNNEGHKQSLAFLYKAVPFLKEMNDQYPAAVCMKLIANDQHAIGECVAAIKYYDSSRAVFFKLNDSASALYCLMMKGHCYYDLGNYKDAYTYGEAAYETSFKLADNDLRITCGAQLCNLFLGADLPQSAIDYMHRIMQLNPANLSGQGVRGAARWVLTIGGLAFLKLNQVDSAAKIAAQLVTIDTADVVETLFGGQLAAAQQHYEKALSFFTTGYHFSQLHNHPIAVAWHASEMARIYIIYKKYAPALFYAKEALQNAQPMHALKEVKNADGILSNIYGETNNFAKAFYFGQQYKALSDSLAPDEYRRILAMIQVQQDLAGEKQAVQLLSKQNLLKESNLRQERTLRNVSVATVLAMLLIGVLIFINVKLKKNKNRALRLMNAATVQLENRKQEQKMAELEREKIDLEMQALRAQMNPHFIFNCLSSINRFILKNETEAASDYLTKFSRLIRMVLVNSKNSFIVLEDELDMLRLYLDMERLRFMDAFSYSINLTNAIDVRSIFIPPLLLQPFAENAIWHGLMHKEGPGLLTIGLSLKKDILYCVITDNGIGREEAARIKTKFLEKQKSMGLQITADRLALLNRNIDEPIFFEIEDVTDKHGNVDGTRVTIKIQCPQKTATYAS